MLYLHGRRPPIVHGNINWHFLLVKTDWTLKVGGGRSARVCDSRAHAARAPVWNQRLQPPLRGALHARG